MSPEYTQFLHPDAAARGIHGCVLLVRAETGLDREAVYRVNRDAFGREDEARLVDQVRYAAAVSLVATLGRGQVVGHILFTPVSVDSVMARPPALGLAPMAVVPEHQGRGIGSALVRRGLECCDALGTPFVVVLGHASYYPRFGFVRASAHGLRYEEDVPDEAFMVYAPGNAPGRGTVRYLPPFRGH